jgi:hypothetical protein
MRCGASQSSGSERPTGRQDCCPGGTPARSSSSAELADDDRGQPHGLDRAQPCRSNFYLVNNKSGVCSRFVYLFARTAAMPCYKNAYQPPPPPTYSSDIHLTTPAEVYDLNFCFNQPAIDNLKGDGRQVELEPLIVRLRITALDMCRAALDADQPRRQPFAMLGAPCSQASMPSCSSTTYVPPTLPTCRHPSGQAYSSVFS